MRLRNKNWTISYIEENKAWFLNGDNYSLSKNKFINNNEIHLEIGCGKGNFIINKSMLNEKINYIAIERERTVIGVALKKAIEYFKTLKSNLRFLNIDAKNIKDYFKDTKIGKLYLNFSDPWPKKRHSKNRLTHISYLNLYFDLLKVGGIIEIKTDNKDLYLFTINEVSDSKFKIIYKTDDLYQDQNEINKNIPTEYEIKFKDQGKKIYKIQLTKNLF
ncbi:tRNA (guanine-N(7)-)-methyltransferase [Spiroplasma corruscae]|uniref:tRNA (guanine-N(7)-)-methyltransferase n=1 Tax=Spiroplasma corruscae TaxID=216934 RepID=A0A222EMW4_9MOLU|nr:tRNA (guanosine(46)-N7)-methyltransferase TrmB [Spiroplasma corruscae]ASP27847.1 tRNA (guanine-N(7)-)-methyltransferase [Spiroplasma corruscae]